MLAEKADDMNISFLFKYATNDTYTITCSERQKLTDILINISQHQVRKEKDSMNSLPFARANAHSNDTYFCYPT